MKREQDYVVKQKNVQGWNKTNNEAQQEWVKQWNDSIINPHGKRSESNLPIKTRMMTNKTGAQTRKMTNKSGAQTYPDHTTNKENIYTNKKHTYKKGNKEHKPEATHNRKEC
jgi:hypothetical protein